MKKGTWNRMESIPINSLSDKELKEAMKDWAEGNRHLEKLLWTCYETGVETSGCHSGHGIGIPYIDFRVDSSSRTKLENLLTATLGLGSAQVFLSFSGNPRSGPDWYMPTILVSPYRAKDTTKFFKKLCSSLKNNRKKNTDEFINEFMDIYEFMKDKETPLNFRLRVNGGNQYTISIECYMNNRDWNYYSNLFTSIGFVEENDLECPDKAISWKYSVSAKDEFSSIMQKLYQTLIKNWTLELPEEITEDMTDVSKALLMRRKFGTDRKGIELLNEWLNENKEPHMRDVNY